MWLDQDLSRGESGQPAFHASLCCHSGCAGAASDSEEQLAEYERQESGVVGGDEDEEMSSDGEDVSGEGLLGGSRV